VKSFQNLLQGYGEHIKNLWLQNNHISTIEDDAFDDLHSLQWLKLWNNNLQTLHYELMEPVLDTLIHLDIHSNPLVCDCEMRWYKRWYHDGWQDVDEDHIKNTSCTDPTDHQEHPIHKVNLDHMYCPRARLMMPSSSSPSTSQFLPTMTKYAPNAHIWTGLLCLILSILNVANL